MKYWTTPTSWIKRASNQIDLAQLDQLRMGEYRLLRKFRTLTEKERLYTESWTLIPSFPNNAPDSPIYSTYN